MHGPLGEWNKPQSFRNGDGSIAHACENLPQPNALVTPTGIEPVLQP